MGNYIIVPTNTDLNRGDQALIWETINIFKEIDSQAEFLLINSGETEEEKYLQSYQTKQRGHKFIDPLVNHPGRGEKEKNNQFYSKSQFLYWGIQAIKDLIPRLLLLSKNRLLNKIALKFLTDSFVNSYSQFKRNDAIIFKGGGFIHSYGKTTDPYVMFYLLYYAMLAKKHNKPVIFMPNSFGPFKNPFATWIIKKVLKNVEFISVREKFSKNSLEKLLGKEIPFYPDLGFFLEDNHQFNAKSFLEEKGIKFNGKNVGITVRPYRFDGHLNPIQAYENYIEAFIEFAKKLHEKGYSPIFIAQTMGPSVNEDDNEAIKKIVSKMKNFEYKVISEKSLNASQMKKIYGEMNFVVGTRFHSVIFSLSSKVPSLAVSYGGNKGKGIMTELGLEKYEIPIEDLNTSSLEKKFFMMVENQKEYIEKIDFKIKEYSALRKELILVLTKILKVN
ncbi:polysaccharide pyruvyl transferase family protein [Paenisporosarcina sp. TG20]|uniref:polysaccharide pyruvyl transferase family protein n=1 Tax=Paenisporosarcina sp. TG20 TaxID=1211706 RepID=UPI000301257F|nr:polysaccharide pyruvyl transferase family protein [Paenisporosarcina sp. TG20]